MNRTLIVLTILFLVCQTKAFSNVVLKKATNIDLSILPSNYVVDGFSTCPLDIESLKTIVDAKQGLLIPDTTSSQELGNTPLSIYEMNQWNSFLSHLDSVSLPSVLTSYDEKPVYFFIFDGTWNDKNTDKPKTIPAKLYDQLNALQTSNSRIRVKYFSGVGTRASFFDELWEGITGKGSEQRANEAFARLREVINDLGEEPHIYAIGFSRGAATARHFLNLVDSYYFKDYLPSQHGRSPLSQPRIYAMLFDTVATGQLNTLNLDIPANVKSAVHFVAASEQRSLFPVARIGGSDSLEGFEKKLHEFDLPGVHSDIGGGYGDSLEKLSHLSASILLEKQGIYVEPLIYDNQYLLNMGKNDSRWLKLGEPDTQKPRKQVSLETKKYNDDKYLDLDGHLIKILEDFGLHAHSALQSLDKLKRDLKSGKKKTFQGLVINLFLTENFLTVQTNCPDHVSVNLQEGYVEVLERPFIAMTSDFFQMLRSSYGLIKQYPYVNRGNFVDVNQ